MNLFSLFVGFVCGVLSMIALAFIVNSATKEKYKSELRDEILDELCDEHEEEH
jgi:hypothetical protein